MPEEQRQSEQVIRIVLLNPNTNARTTADMLQIAREACTEATNVQVEGRTVPRGVPLIYNEEMLAAAEEVVVDFLTQELEPGCDGVIIAAFGDPGVARSRSLFLQPVVGIGEAAIAEAGAGRRRFGIVTTTPLLVNSIQARVAALGFSPQFCGVYLTEGDMETMMANSEVLENCLRAACQRAADDGAEALVIGGGPLAVAGRAIAADCPVPLIEPIAAAVRLALLRATRSRM